MSDPIQLSDLRTHVGFLVGEGRTDATTLANIDNCINNAYVWAAGIRGFWRRRSTTLTLVAGQSAYDLASAFSDIFALYYRHNGQVLDVEIVSDREWLEVSATSSNDVGDPRWARVTQTSSTLNQLELSPPPSSNFISATSSTLTLEYFIEITRLTSATDELILPANLRHYVEYPAAYEYALAQNDFGLADRLKLKTEEIRLLIMKHDLTRTGKARQLRPVAGYYPDESRAGYDYR